MGSPVLWFDLGAKDPEPLRAFYRDLFGWKLQPAGEAYTTVATGGGINGGIGRSDTGDPWITFYVGVPDAQAMLDKAESLGARTVVPVTEVPGMGRFALFDDPDGLLIGLMTAAGDGAGPDLAGEGVGVDWFEVIGSDAKRSQAFYGELFGWRYDEMGESYGLVDTGGEGGIPGGVGGTGEEGSRWATLYAAVDDVERYLARAVELGGSRVYGPIDIDDHMQSGALHDPVGNVFGVYHHAPH